MTPKIQEIPLTSIKEAENNPNYMEPEKFELLKNAIERYGFLQPILVSPDKSGGTYTIVDGHHRLKAASDLGMTEIPCVVKSLGKEKKMVGAISMNKLRGELNLTMVAHDLSELVDKGWDIADLTVTGFTDDEIESLIESTKALGDDTEFFLEEPEEDTKVKLEAPQRYSIEVVFTTKEEMDLVVNRLEELGGADKNYGEILVGLLSPEDSA